jgi:hypothetical protein
MDLIERYLGAVRWNLPAARADDIVAELGDLIAARIEDREERLDRALTREEVSSVLREFGHPLVVAGQYHGQRALIGPEIFPFYWFALKIVLAVVLVIGAIQFAGRLVTGNEAVVAAFAHGVSGTVSSLLLNAAWVTLAFALVERTGLLAAYLERWKPEELPDIPALRVSRPKGAKGASRKRVGEAITSIVAGAVFLAWWFGAVRVPFLPADADFAVRGAPIWGQLFWPVAALVAVSILRGLISLFRPDWKPLRAALAIGGAAGTLAIAAVLHQAGRIVLVTPLGRDAAQAAEIQGHLDMSLGIAIAATAIVTVVQCAVELWQIYREGSRR